MKKSISEVISKEPKYRRDQLYKAMFSPAVKGYEEISTFPLELREKLKKYPWLSVKLKAIQKSKADNTEKALLELHDGLCIETVLMARPFRGDASNGVNRTICISSQVGCGMGCVFCATGRMGFKRNLTAEEIIDQYRFWQNHLAHSSHEATKGAAKEGDETIGNIVVMGQGEPLLNYENVKKALNIILKNTDIGQSKITLSTVGEKAAMGKLLRDKDFPAVRIAISLHSAVEKTRKKIVPSAQIGFIDFLVKWSEEYHKTLGSRSHFLSLEYVMLSGINDNEVHLKALINLARKMGRVKINLIPLNQASGPVRGIKNIASNGAGGMEGSSQEVIKKWQDAIMKAGVTCTVRHSQGADIAAACGQLTSI